jgi:hypothetical protein
MAGNPVVSELSHATRRYKKHDQSMAILSYINPDSGLPGNEIQEPTTLRFEKT